MSVHDLQLVAVKRDWVPEWLFSIAKHWMPLAELLCEPVQCAWGCRQPATALVLDVPDTELSWPNGVPTCDIHMLWARSRRP